MTLCDWLSLTSEINRCAKQIGQPRQWPRGSNKASHCTVMAPSRRHRLGGSEREGAGSCWGVSLLWESVLKEDLCPRCLIIKRCLRFAVSSSKWFRVRPALIAAKSYIIYGELWWINYWWIMGELNYSTYQGHLWNSIYAALTAVWDYCISYITCRRRRGWGQLACFRSLIWRGVLSQFVLKGTDRLGFRQLWRSALAACG